MKTAEFSTGFDECRVASLRQARGRRRNPQGEGPRASPIVHVLLSEPVVVSLHQLAGEAGDVGRKGKDLAEQTRIAHNVEGSNNTIVRGGNHPRRKIAHVNNLHRHGVTHGRQYSTGSGEGKASDPVSESVALIAGASDEAGPGDQKSVPENRGRDALCVDLGLAVVAQIIRLNNG